MGRHTAAGVLLTVSKWGALGPGLGEPHPVSSRAGSFSHHKALPLAPSSLARAGVTGYLPAGPEPWEPPSHLEPPSLPLHHCLQLWPNGELGEEEGEARSGRKQLEQAEGFAFLTLLFKYLVFKLTWKYLFKNSYQFNINFINNTLKISKMFYSSVKNN